MRHPRPLSLNPDGPRYPQCHLTQSLSIVRSIGNACCNSFVECTLSSGGFSDTWCAHSTILCPVRLRVWSLLCVMGRIHPRSRGQEGNANQCDKYPISLFANAFMENQQLFRLILSHCRRNDCVLTPMLSTTLLELTLDEWNAAKWTGDMQAGPKVKAR